MQKLIINNLTGIRFYLFLIIFIRHFDWINISYQILPSWHTLHCVNWAVTFFFVLSGFCIALNHDDMFKKLNTSNFFNFLKTRFLKLYPLYFITGIICFLLIYLPQGKQWLNIFLFKYIPMLNTFSDKYFASTAGNDAGWFIGALFFCYLLIPVVRAVLTNKQMLLLAISGLIIICILDDKYSIYLYYCPFARFIQFLFGYLSAIYQSIYLSKTKPNQTSNCNLLRHNVILKNITDILFILCIFCSVYFIGAQNSYHKVHILNYLLYLPIICLFIAYLCIKGNSFLTKILESKFSIFLSKISFEAYLIHYVLISITPKFISVNTKIEALVIGLLILILTIILSLIWQYLQKKVEFIFKNKILQRN